MRKLLEDGKNTKVTSVKSRRLHQVSAPIPGFPAVHARGLRYTFSYSHLDRQIVIQSKTLPMELKKTVQSSKASVSNSFHEQKKTVGVSIVRMIIPAARLMLLSKTKDLDDLIGWNDLCKYPFWQDQILLLIKSPILSAVAEVGFARSFLAAADS